MKRLTILLLALISACQPSPGLLEKDESVVEPLPAGYFGNEQKCVASWRILVAEWHAKGGRVLPSIELMREAMERDTDSRLAAIFRAAWQLQLDKPGADPGLTFAEAATPYTPADCGAYTTLGEALASVDGVMDESAMSWARSRMPERFVEEEGIWIASELVKADK